MASTNIFSDKQSFEFDLNTLSLFHLWGNKSIEELSIGPYTEIIKQAHQSTLDQYSYWLSLTDDQKSKIEYFVYDTHRHVIVNIDIVWSLT
jgi:hypothetical protein